VAVFDVGGARRIRPLTNRTQVALYPHGRAPVRVARKVPCLVVSIEPQFGQIGPEASTGEVSWGDGPFDSGGVVGIDDIHFSSHRPYKNLRCRVAARQRRSANYCNLSLFRTIGVPADQHTSWMGLHFRRNRQ